MEKFWKNKKVLITGVNGFIGSNIAIKLLELSAQVVGIDIDLRKKSLLSFHNKDKNLTLEEINVIDLESVNKIIEKNNIEHIIHLAAEVEVHKSQEIPFQVFESNVRGTYTICEAVRISKSRIKSCIIASSDKSYGHYPEVDLPYKEDYLLNPKYIYETSKAAADLIAKSYTTNKINLPLVVTRFCNIYGPGQFNNTVLITDLIKCFLRNEKFVPRSDGEMKRDFVYIKDVVELYLLISEKLTFNKRLSGEIYNLGTNYPVKIKDVVILIGELMNKESESKVILDLMKTKKTHSEIQNQWMEFGKLYEHYSYQPKFSLAQGLTETINWAKSEYL